MLNPDPAILLRLLLLSPLLEEWVIRAGLQEWLVGRQRGAALTLLAPAAAFSLLHLGAGWQAVAGVFLPGLALSVIYRRWRDWRLCAFAHAGFNAFSLAFCGLNIY